MALSLNIDVTMQSFMNGVHLSVASSHKLARTTSLSCFCRQLTCRVVQTGKARLADNSPSDHTHELSYPAVPGVSGGETRELVSEL